MPDAEPLRVSFFANSTCFLSFLILQIGFLVTVIAFILCANGETCGLFVLGALVSPSTVRIKGRTVFFGFGGRRVPLIPISDLGLE